MKTKAQQALQTVRNSVLEIMRNHHDLTWQADGYWWWGLQCVWSDFNFMRHGDPVKEKDLYWALVDMDVPRESIVTRGARTYVELDNITFVYRTRHFKGGYEPLEIAPHIKGRKYTQCGHSYIHPQGSVYELAQRMIDLDRWLPEIKDTAKQAYLDGLQERKIREIKLQTAGVFLRDHFQGEIPHNVVDYKIYDSEPGAMDFIRLSILDDGKPSWAVRYFDIPFDNRNLLFRDAVTDFIEKQNSRRGWLEMFLDEDTGESIPILVYEPYTYWE